MLAKHYLGLFISDFLNNWLVDNSVTSTVFWQRGLLNSTLIPTNITNFKKQALIEKTKRE